eukprot:69108_1
MLTWLFKEERKQDTEEKLYPIDPFKTSESIDNITFKCGSICYVSYLTFINDVKKMLDKRAFNEDYKIEKLIHKQTDYEIFTVLRKDNNHKAICKIYNVNNNYDGQS